MKSRLEKLETGMDTSEKSRLEVTAVRIRDLLPAPSDWEKMNTTQRYWRLESVGRALCRIYDTGSPETLPKRFPEHREGTLLGLFDNGEHRIAINETLLHSKEPQDALRTFLHEWRHAYQREMASRCDSQFHHLCHDVSLARDWRRNLEPGRYVSAETDPEGYWSQPVERDARAFADELVASYVRHHNRQHEERS